jgi:hypothetical protein
MKTYLDMQDESYTSAHIKAGRKIMVALKRLRDKRLYGMNSTIQGGFMAKAAARISMKMTANGFNFDSLHAPGNSIGSRLRIEETKNI